MLRLDFFFCFSFTFYFKNVCTTIIIKDFSLGVAKTLETDVGKSSPGSYFYKSLFVSFIVQKLRVLAKRLAENLNLNYFDVKANSKDRILFHHIMPLEIQKSRTRPTCSHTRHESCESFRLKFSNTPLEIVD